MGGVVVNFREWHKAFDEPDAQAWRISSEGVELPNVGTLRTDGDPLTIRGLWRQYRPEIQAAAEGASVCVELILATIATESVVVHGERDPKQVRCEPRYKSDEATPDRISVGLTHPLISTAREVLGVPVGRAWLGVPANNLRVCATVIRHTRALHGFDAIKVAAVYNAGSLRKSTGNRWRLASTHDHLDRFARWFGDACAVIRDGGGCSRDMTWLLSMHDAGLL